MSVAEMTPRGDEFERTPPHDIVAERCVLGGMLLSRDAIADVIETITPRDHYRPAHQIVHEVILDLYGRGEPADAVTVAAELSRRGEIARVGGADYMHTLIASVPTAANAGYYAKIVRERAILRRLVEVGTRIVQLGYTGDAEADQLVDQAQAEIFAVTDRRVSEDYLPLSEIMPGALDEIEAIGSRGGGMTGVPTGFADLDALTNGLHAGQMIVIAARPAIGKALALDTPLPTPAGWTTMGEVRPGDLLLAADGTATKVVAATEVMTGRPCYEVRFDDGTAIVADAEHGWLTGTSAAAAPSVTTTRELAAVPAAGAHVVALPSPLQLPEADLPLPPYVLGVWLGSGTSTVAQFASADPEIAMLIADDGIEAPRLSSQFRYGLQLVDVKLPAGRSRTSGARRQPLACPVCGGRFTGLTSGYSMCRACAGSRGSVQAILRALGVLGDKHIPADYLRGSQAQRRALLAGLLDSSGTVAETGFVRVEAASEQLAADVRELVVSLGYRCGQPEAHTVAFGTDDDVFRLERKQLAHKERRSAQAAAQAPGRRITAVEPVPSVPVRCVQVDSPDHLYLASRSMIPTHNSTLALDLARAAAIRNRMTVVIFSLEMSRNEITMRLLSAEAKVSLHTIRTGALNDDDWSRLARRMSEVADAPLFIDDSPNMSLMEIRSKCRRLKQRNDLRLVIIDYLQLMSSPKRVENRQQEVSEMSRSLKLLAKELETPVIAVSQLNRGPEQRTNKQPMISDLRESGCLTAETRILRADTGAEVSLGELLATGERDVPVWSLDERLRLVPRPLTHAFPSGTKEVFRVRLASGREIHATANHPFLAYQGWCPLGELTVGSRVAVPRRMPGPLTQKELPEPEIVMLAHLIGDGSFVKRQPIRYASTDEANLLAVSDAAKHFGITAVRDDHEAARCTSLRLPAPYRLARGKRNPIASWLDALGLFGLRSHEKFIPSRIFSLPDRQLALFLHHLWATDGSVTVGKTGAIRVYYSTTSERLARDLQLLLLRFDIMARLHAVGNTYGRPQWTLDVTGVRDQRRFLDGIGVHGNREAAVIKARKRLDTMTAAGRFDTIPAEVWQKVSSAMDSRLLSKAWLQARVGTSSAADCNPKFSPTRTRLTAIAEVLDNDELRMLAASDVYWDRITSIENIGEQPVYDATVSGTHNFIANGTNLHNSIEQDADMVILLHREDAYERESPRAGEADLIVAKHRNGPTATVTVAFQGHYSRFVDMAPG